MEEKEIWVTTYDNPYNPFTQYQHWLAYDESHGYCTSGLIANEGYGDSENLSDEEMDYLQNQAIMSVADRGIAVGMIGDELRYISFYRLVTPKDCVNY